MTSKRLLVFGVSSSKSLVTEPQNVFPARMTTASVLDFHTRKHYDIYAHANHSECTTAQLWIPF